MPKHVTSGGIHLRGLAPGQHSSEKISLEWLVIGETLSDLSGLGIEPQTSRTNSDVLSPYRKIKIK